ncbi:MAG: TIM barrel protein [Nanoarchaeota archaeon]
MSIRFGPAGIGGVNEALKNLEEYRGLGIRACEIAFTYGIYIKNKEDAEKIGKMAKESDIKLSIHAPYWINLNSEDAEKVRKSKERIIECCKVGTWLKAELVVFHPGYYSIKRTPGSSYDISSKNGSGLIDKEKTYEKIKNEILEMQKILKEKNYTTKLALETTGKLNVFGSVEEISQLVKDTGCHFCIDFAHILAREKDYKFKEVFEKFEKTENAKNSDEMHIHFSGIEYGEKGEKKHKKTDKKEWKKLLENLPKDKNIVIINESPTPVEDSLDGLTIKHSLK